MFITHYPHSLHLSNLPSLSILPSAPFPLPFDDELRSTSPGLLLPFRFCSSPPSLFLAIRATLPGLPVPPLSLTLILRVLQLAAPSPSESPPPRLASLRRPHPFPSSPSSLYSSSVLSLFIPTYPLLFVLPDLSLTSLSASYRFPSTYRRVAVLLLLLLFLFTKVLPFFPLSSPPALAPKSTPAFNRRQSFSIFFAIIATKSRPDSSLFPPPYSVPPSPSYPSLASLTPFRSREDRPPPPCLLHSLPSAKG